MGQPRCSKESRCHDYRVTTKKVLAGIISFGICIEKDEPMAKLLFEQIKKFYYLMVSLTSHYMLLLL